MGNDSIKDLAQDTVYVHPTEKQCNWEPSVSSGGAVIVDKPVSGSAISAGDIVNFNSSNVYRQENAVLGSSTISEQGTASSTLDSNEAFMKIDDTHYLTWYQGGRSSYTITINVYELVNTGTGYTLQQTATISKTNMHGSISGGLRRIHNVNRDDSQAPYLFFVTGFYYNHIMIFRISDDFTSISASAELAPCEGSYREVCEIFLLENNTKATMLSTENSSSYYYWSQGSLNITLGAGSNITASVATKCSDTEGNTSYRQWMGRQFRSQIITKWPYFVWFAYDKDETLYATSFDINTSGKLTRHVVDTKINDDANYIFYFTVTHISGDYYLVSDRHSFANSSLDITYYFKIIKIDAPANVSIVNNNFQLVFSCSSYVSSDTDAKYGLAMTNIGDSVYVRTCYTLHKGELGANGSNISFTELPIINLRQEYAGRILLPGAANKYPMIIDGHQHGTELKYTIGQLYNNQWYTYVRDTNASTMAFALNSANPGENCKALVDGSAEYAGATRGFTKTPESEVEQDIYVYSPADGFVSAIPRKYRTIV